VGRKRRLKVQVKRVRPGTLAPNLQDEYTSESPVERRNGMLRAVALGLANMAGRASVSNKESSTEATASPSKGEAQEDTATGCRDSAERGS
jgi:hypothetical protein